MEIAASKPAFQNEPASQLSFNEVCCHRIDMNLGVSLFRAARGSLYPMICSLQPSKSCGTPQSEGSSTEISTLFVKVPGRHVLCPLISSAILKNNKRKKLFVLVNVETNHTQTNDRWRKDKTCGLQQAKPLYGAACDCSLTDSAVKGTKCMNQE